MKFTKFNIFLILSLLSAVPFADASFIKGVVVVGERGCVKRDYVVIDTNLGYIYAQQFSGSFDKGDIVVGELNSFGFKDVSINTSRKGRLWIDDFMLSRSRAAEKCFQE